jgi:hypothetical protein
VLLALEEAGEAGLAVAVRSTCERPAALESGVLR